jgi:hypothetical protein
MALSLIVIGLLLVISAVQNTQGTLFTTVRQDMTGPDNFIQWIAALALVGAIGYVPKLRGFSIALLALVLLAIFLRNGTGFFAQLQSALQGTLPFDPTLGRGTKGGIQLPQASSYSAAS